MTWVVLFDLIKDVVELLFYLIAGPLLSVYVVKQLARQGRRDRQLLELQRRLNQLEGHEAERSIESVILFLKEPVTSAKTDNCRHRTFRSEVTAIGRVTSRMARVGISVEPDRADSNSHTHATAGPLIGSRDRLVVVYVTL